MFCASPGYLAAHGTPRIPADLASHDCVTYAGWMSTDTWTFRVNGLEVGLPVRTRLLVSTAEAALDAAVAGVGIACALSHQIAGSVQKGELAVVLRRFEPAPLAVSLVYNAQRFVPRRLRSFCDFAAPRLKEILSTRPC